MLGALVAVLLASGAVGAALAADARAAVDAFVARLGAVHVTQPGGRPDADALEHRPLAGGFAFPYRQEAFVDGTLVLLVVVRSAQVNTNPDDALFDPDRLKGGG